MIAKSSCASTTGTRAHGEALDEVMGRSLVKRPTYLASLVSWVCSTQTDCRARPRVCSCCLFTLVYLTEELVDPGNSRSFAPAPFHFTALDTVELVQLLREVSRSSFLPPFRDLCIVLKLCEPITNCLLFIHCYYVRALLCPMVQVGYTTRFRSLRYTQPRACGTR